MLSIGGGKAEGWERFRRKDLSHLAGGGGLENTERKKNVSKLKVRMMDYSHAHRPQLLLLLILSKDKENVTAEPSGVSTMHFKRARLPSDVSSHSGLSLSFSGCFTGCSVTSAPHIFEKCTPSGKPWEVRVQLNWLPARSALWIGSSRIYHAVAWHQPAHCS